MTKIEEFNKLTADKRQAKLRELEHELIESRRSMAAGELVNPRVITKTRKDIARLKTVINQPSQQEEAG